MIFNPIGYIKESRLELSRIVWPTRKETLRFTVIVIIASVIIGTYVAGIDFILTTLADNFLYK
jgi:preprotein translocase subunit SecE